MDPFSVDVFETDPRLDDDDFFDATYRQRAANSPSPCQLQNQSVCPPAAHASPFNQPVMHDNLKTVTLGTTAQVQAVINVNSESRPNFDWTGHAAPNCSYVESDENRNRKKPVKRTIQTPVRSSYAGRWKMRMSVRPGGTSHRSKPPRAPQKCVPGKV